jgi:four helix bundle protein
VTRPREHLVTAQLRRSALSIASNIAEGCGKRSRAESIRYLEIASGSTAETEHHLLSAAGLDILPGARCEALADEAIQIRRMIRSLIEHFPSDGESG